ncbi:MAG: hypothetical protein COW03_17470 [Cytophagales bacterium CG12_big_fil_rev_8_21_14_0_65_40_12]|nr:MAG: hypothetical protein COW03_17470 [Cytophagales bacterium CG12_big_fil_rev_8_21_14_0_65_40_12]PIW06118.1 MAG: hypothetical protein COW40_00885 [Cytophagales bacterium CG17_big_fil_post_rev_8_21_14_2_50_40_13]
MKISWNDLTVDFSHINPDKLLQDWVWLIGEGKKPILVSSIGDLFLTDKSGKCFWLNAGEGILEEVAESLEEFEIKLKDNKYVNEWFLIALVKIFKEKGFELTDRCLYSFKKLPVLGGEYEPENFEITDIEVHFSLSGQINQKIKDLPEGTNINSITIK